MKVTKMAKNDIDIVVIDSRIRKNFENEKDKILIYKNRLDVIDQSLKGMQFLHTNTKQAEN